MRKYVKSYFPEVMEDVVNRAEHFEKQKYIHII